MSNIISNLIFTFDLYLHLTLISSSNVAHNTEVRSLVLDAYVSYLQCPIVVCLKTIPFEIPLSIF